MVSHRAQAQFERAGWRGRILFPLWTLQLVLTLLTMVLASGSLSETVKHRGKEGRNFSIELIWEIFNIVVSLVATLCTLFEVIRYLTELLTPWTMLFTHVVKMTCALAIFVLDIVVYTRRKEYQSLGGLVLDTVFLVTAVALAVYAILRHRRLSQLDDYAHPVDAKAYGLSDVDSTADRRASLGSHRPSLGSANEAVPSVAMTPAVYTHERDTRFDEYVARRGMSGLVTKSWPLASPSSPPASLLSGRTRSTSYASDHVLDAVPEESETWDSLDLHHDKRALLDRGRPTTDDGGGGAGPS